MPQAVLHGVHPSWTTSSLQISPLLLREAVCAYMHPYMYMWAHHKL